MNINKCNMLRHLEVSILNVFNAYDVKYNNPVNIPDGRLIFSQSMPFSALINPYVGF